MAAAQNGSPPLAIRALLNPTDTGKIRIGGDYDQKEDEDEMSTPFARGVVCRASRWWVRNGHRQTRTKVIYGLEPEDERVVLTVWSPSNAADLQHGPTGGKPR